MQFLALFAAVSSALLVGVNAAAHTFHARNHTELARRQNNGGGIGDSKWSFYNTETGNAGSCGRRISNGEFVVAMNQGEYNPSMCFKRIVMSFQANKNSPPITAVATVGDACPGCPPHGLDLSIGLFSHFASQDVGIIYGKWWFEGQGGPAPPPPPPPPQPKPETKTKAWTPPAPTWTPPPPPPSPASTKKKSTSAPPPSSSAAASSAPSPPPTSSTTPPTSTEAATSISSTGTAAAASTPSGTTFGPGNFRDMNTLVAQLGGVVAGGAYAE